MSSRNALNATKKTNKMLGWVFFLAYLMLLLYFLFFAEAFGRVADGGSSRSMNLVPFLEIKRYYYNWDTLGTISVLNLFGNVIAFLPFGFFRSIVGFRRPSFLRTFVQGTLFSLGVECVQFICNVGSFDVDDIILNSFGVLLGYSIYFFFRRKL